MIIKAISRLRTKIQTEQLTKNKIVIGVAGLVILIILVTAGSMTFVNSVNQAKASETDSITKNKKNYFLVIYDYFIAGQKELHHIMLKGKT